MLYFGIAPSLDHRAHHRRRHGHHLAQETAEESADQYLVHFRLFLAADLLPHPRLGVIEICVIDTETETETETETLRETGTGQGTRHRPDAARIMKEDVPFQEGILIDLAPSRVHAPLFAEDLQDAWVFPGVRQATREEAQGIVVDGRGVEALTHWPQVVQGLVLIVTAVRVPILTRQGPLGVGVGHYDRAEAGVGMILGIVGLEVVVLHKYGAIKELPLHTIRNFRLSLRSYRCALYTNQIRTIHHAHAMLMLQVVRIVRSIIRQERSEPIVKEVKSQQTEKLRTYIHSHVGE